MEKKPLSGIALTLIITSTLYVTFNLIPVITAETTEEYPAFSFVHAVGNYFEITNSTYLNITFTSTETVHVFLESVPRMISLFIESNSSATSTTLTFSGFKSGNMYYRYEDGYLIEDFTTDSSGEYRYTQDISEPHHVFIQENLSTLYITSNYTFTSDIYEPIVVAADNIMIEGNGYTLQGSGSGVGFYLNGRTNVTIKNVIVKGWGVGIDLKVGSTNNSILGNRVTSNTHGGIALWDSSNYNSIVGNNVTSNYGGGGIGLAMGSSYNTISGNTIANNVRWGILLFFRPNNNNLIYHNNIIDNIVQAYDENPVYNNWHDPDRLEGNYWSDYLGVDDGSGTGKHAIAGDGIGDTNIPWPGPDYDYYPLMSPWPPAPPIITAAVDVDPDTLNLKSNGEWITAYIELPEGYDVSEIDVGSILLNGTISVDVEGLLTVGDYDLDNIPDLMVKFDRAAIIEWLDTNDYGEDTGKYYEINLTITGTVSGTQFAGTDQVRVLKR